MPNPEGINRIREAALARVDELQASHDDAFNAPEVKRVLKQISSATSVIERKAALDAIWESVAESQRKYFKKTRPITEEFHEIILGLIEEDLETIENELESFPDEEEENELNKKKEELEESRKDIEESLEKFNALQKLSESIHQLSIGERLNITYQLSNYARWISVAFTMIAQILEYSDVEDDYRKPEKEAHDVLLAESYAQQKLVYEWLKTQFNFENKEQLRGKKIVLVEGAPSYTKLLTDLFQYSGAIVEHTRSVAATKREFKGTPDLIIATGSIHNEQSLDAPGKSSIPTIEAIFDKFPGINIPIVCYTNFRPDADQQADLETFAEQNTTSPEPISDIEGFCKLLNQALTK